jgi:anti-sigma factor RsiW
MILLVDKPGPAFHADPKRPLKEVTAYLHDELDGPTKEAFEEHLKSCPKCQHSVTIGRKLFPIVNALMAEDRVPRKAEDYIRLWEEAKSRAEKKSREPKK